MKKIIAFICFVFITCFSVCTVAISTSPITSIVDKFTTDIFSNTKSIFDVICYIFGTYLVLSANYKYKKHVKYPRSRAINKPISYFIIGIIFLLIPLVTNEILRRTF